MRAKNRFRSGIFWWISTLVLAGVAGLLTFQLLNNATPVAAEGIPEAQGETQLVVVAATDIPFRRSISESELVVRRFPIESVPNGVALTIEQVIGKMSSVNIVAGEPIIIEQLVTPDIVTSQLALSIPSGKAVLAVPTNSELISNRLVRPGDHIDLLGTFEMDVANAEIIGTMLESVALMQDLEVHAIILPVALKNGSSSSKPATEEEEAETSGVFHTINQMGQSILLAVDTQDALVVRHVLDSGGVVDLILRAPADDSLVETKPVDQNYLADRYKIDLR